MRRFLPLLGFATSFGLTLAGCARSARPSIGYDLDTSSERLEREPPARGPRVPRDVVRRAAGEVTALRLADGTRLGGAELLRELSAADAICAGEEHGEASHHYAELWLLQRLAEQARYQGLELGIGFEMFQRPYQQALSDFVRGSSDEPTLLRRTQYQKRWGLPFAYYRPLLERARDDGLPAVALNAPSELTRSVAHKGLEALDRTQALALPELDLFDAEHRAEFERMMQGHPPGHGSLDRMYAAQVVWDETMADTAMRWLSVHAPARRLLIVAGRAHCQRRAIPARLERRGAARVVALVLGAAEPASEERKLYDYAVIVD